MKTLIVAGGNPPSFDLLSKYTSTHFIISADKGTDVLYKYNIKPNIILGDFDSAKEESINYFKNIGVTIEKFPKDKDYSDTFLCVEEAIKRGATEIVILGATGIRIDHLIGNINLLYLIKEKGIYGEIVDENNQMFIIESPFEIYGEKGEYFSVFSLGDHIEDLNITNSKYELSNYKLLPKDSLILSNEFTEKPLKINFNGGKLLFIKSFDN